MAKRSKSALDKVVDHLSAIVALSFKIFLFLIVLVLAIVLGREIFVQDAIVVYPIALPSGQKQLAGADPTTASRHLIDEIYEVRRKARSRAPTKVLTPVWEVEDFEVAGTGISYRQGIRVLRYWLDSRPVEITGEVVKLDPSRYQIQIRITGSSYAVVSDTFDEDQFHTKIKQIASNVLGELNPYLFGWYKYQEHEPKAAMKYALKCLDNDSGDDDIWARNLIALLYADDGDFEGARMILQEITQEDSTFSVGYNSMAYVDLIEAKQLDTDGADRKLKEAMIWATRALGGDHSLFEAHINRGLIHMKRDEWSEAEEAFRSAVEIAPSDPDTHFDLANSLKKLGEDEEERGDFVTAKSEYQDSLRHYKRTLQIDPEHPEAEGIEKWMEWLSREIRRLGRLSGPGGSQ